MASTAVFRELVREHMTAAPVIVSADLTCAEVVARMVAGDTTAAIVEDPSGRVQGILTERDVVRRLAFRETAATPVEKVMTAPVMVIAEDDYLYHAIARMRRFKLRHMPVVDAAGHPVGMLNLDAALIAASETLVGQIDALTQERTVDGMREVKSAQVELAEELFSSGLPAPEIQSLLTHINRDIHRRVVDLHLASMAEDGHGDPPVPFSFIIMGSGGRGENFLYPDQDNGIILDDYPDSEHGRIDPWFIAFSERVTRDLDAVGFPLCEGYVMATNPLWRKTSTQWQAQIAGWMRRRGAVALRLSDIFFDFRACCGALNLCADLRTYVTRTVKANPFFLQELYHDDKEQRVALGWFGRFITEKDNPEHRGKINLKHNGTLPLVQSLRLLALREGVPETATLERLDALHAQGLFDRDEYDYLAGAFRCITFLLLRQQIADFKAGRNVTNYVDPESLTEREREELTDAFKAIDRLLDRIRGEFTGDVF